MTQQTVLVTGASSGIGMHLARRFAREGFRLILVGRDPSELRISAEFIEGEHQVQVRTIIADLEQAEGIETIISALAENGTGIDILVNNAGHGFKGLFWEVPLEKHLSIIRLNIEAVIRLTSAILPAMVARGSGRILNLASIAGFEPGPLMSVYHASKAFVLSWSEALATELEDTGVTVTALCPGPTDTDFFPKGDMMLTKAFQKANLMAPQEVADAGFDALMRGERTEVPGAMNKAMIFSRRFMSDALQARVNKAMYEEVAPEDAKRERGDKEREADQK
jgi:uncharacterized protein